MPTADDGRKLIHLSTITLYNSESYFINFTNDKSLFFYR